MLKNLIVPWNGSLSVSVSLFNAGGQLGMIKEIDHYKGIITKGINDIV